MLYGKRRSAPRRKNLKKRSYRPRKAIRKYPIRRNIFKAQQNTASVKEAFTFAVPAGIVDYVRNVQLADAVYDRAQTVAQAYQEFRIKYIKLTFRPSSDTFTPVVGNSIPQLYFMKDLTNSIPTNATADTFYSMGARPVRFDDKNVVRVWKPSVLTSDMTAPLATTAAQIKISPWLATNANSGNPANAWAPSTVDHLGCVFYVTKINATDNIQYFVDLEVEFQFRRPLWKGSDSQQAALQMVNGEMVPIKNTLESNAST